MYIMEICMITHAWNEVPQDCFTSICEWSGPSQTTYRDGYSEVGEVFARDKKILLGYTLYRGAFRAIWRPLKGHYLCRSAV